MVASGSGAGGSATVASGSTSESRPAAGCATVASGSNFLGSSAILVGSPSPVAAILGAEQAFRELDFRLRGLHPGRGRGRRAPQIAVAGRISPFARFAHAMVVAYFLDFSGVFDDEIVGSDEIGKDVVARAMAPKSPLDRMARVTHPPGA